MRHEDEYLIGLFLEQLDRDLRVRYPKLFRHVDRIKNAPGWIPHKESMRHNRPFSSVRARLIECAWCGDDFTALRKRDKYCSTGCAHEMRRFECSR